MGTIPTPPTFTAGQIAGVSAGLNTFRDTLNFWSNTPKCLAQEIASLSIPNNADTVVAMTGELYDVVQAGDSPSHDAVTTNSRVYCRTTGKYDLLASACFSANSTGVRRVTLRINGGATLTQATANATSGISTTIAAGPIVYPLTAGDYLEMLVFQNSGGALTLNGGSPGPSYLQMLLIGA